jgi:DNA invertase Pin-like site-specific DNA recombinase
MGDAMGKRALGYVRVSTAEQVEGYGLAVQEQAVRGYCREHGLRVVEVLRDEGQSGSNGLDDRLGLGETLARLERGDADVLVVARLDRLARDLLLQETTMERLRAAGVEVVSVAEPDVDSDDPTRVLVRQLLGAIAQYERSVIKGRMVAGKAAKVAGGGYGGGRPGYGQKAEGGALVADPDEQRLVGRVAELRSQGQSYRAICAVLEAEGYEPRRAKRWSPVVVRSIAKRSAARA